MKFPSFAGIAAAAALAFCALFPSAASAQTRDGVFTVSGVRVDSTAANAAQAQADAFASAYRQAFDRLARRITLGDDLQRLGAPRPDQAVLERMAISVDIEEERRSSTRYIGRLAVRFNDGAVRAYLQQLGFSVIEARSPPTLVAPVASAALGEEGIAAWRAAWDQGGFGQELAPLVVAPITLSGAPDWRAAQPYAQIAAAASALYATLQVSGGVATATLVEVGPGGPPRDRGAVTARIGAGGLPEAAQALAAQANERIQAEWKTRAASRSGQRGRVSASALYANQAQWERIKAGLEAAAATTISEIRIEAVAREGALVSFSFVGDREQLAAELRRQGVIMEEGQIGPTLRVAAGR
ncbi:MAG: DUF2066 domain-containing protein [Hyphomonadaceae bacterium]|nr:DUF2066 domain-containing protein [Hyphomonadaceae bacterium]